MRLEVLFWVLTFPRDANLIDFALKNSGGCVPAVKF